MLSRLLSAVITMATIGATACPGLQTNQNDIGGEPGSGGLIVGDNIVITRDGIIEPRRGLMYITTLTETNYISRLGYYSKAIVVATKREPTEGHPSLIELQYSSNGGVTWGVLAELESEPDRILEARGNLYAASQEGVSRVETLAASQTAFSAGIPPARDIYALSGVALAVVSSGITQPPKTAAAYRAIWTHVDATGNKLVGAPSSRVIAKNTSASVTDDKLVSTAIPSNAPSNSVVEFYRSKYVSIATDENADPGDELFLVGKRTVPTSKVVTGLAYDSGFGTVITATTSVAHGLAPGDVVSTGHGSVSGSGGSTFPLGTKYVATVPTPTTFTYFGSGVPGGTASGLTITMNVLAVGILDQTLEELVGEALYTNPTQGSILAAQYPPPSARDIAMFRGSMFFADTVDVQRLSISLLSVGSPNGLISGDTVTVGGETFTASSTEIPNDVTNTFFLTTTGTASKNVEDTANSLVRAINRHGSGHHYTGASYLSGPNDPPGMISIWLDNPAGSLVTASSSRGTAFFGLGNSSADTRPNGLSWSNQLQPDAVPLLSYARIGADEKKILRIVPLRDSLIVIKEDGVWRLTGDSPDTFRIDPLDLTSICVAAGSAVALENTVFALSRHGVVRISDTGVTVISRPIENLLRPLITGALGETTAEIAHAVGYESDHKYILWAPASSDEAEPSQAYVYDFFTQAWTRWTVSSIGAIVDPVLDKLFIASGDEIRVERKTLTPSDYADDENDVTVVLAQGPSVTLSSSTGVDAGDRLLQDGASAVILSKAGADPNAVLTLDRILSLEMRHQDATITPSDGFLPPFTAMVISQPSSTEVIVFDESGISIGDSISNGFDSALIADMTGTLLTLDAELPFVDFTGGEAKIEKAIPVDVEWNTQFGDPGSVIHSREVDIFFRSVYYASAWLRFASNLHPSVESVPIYGTLLVDPPTAPSTIRVSVPRNEQRSNRLSVRFSMQQAQCAMQIQGFQIVFEPGRERVSR
jgi:hypothetical protein